MKHGREESKKDLSSAEIFELSPTQADTLDAMRRNREPWCLNKRTAAALLRRGLIVEAGVCCKEHSDPTYVLAPGKDRPK